MPEATDPVGVFDSGVGGLSVLREIRRELPAEDLLYVADSAFAPYGDKSPSVIQSRTAAIVRWLERQGVKLIVVACNTATGVAVDALRAGTTTPIVAIEPAVKPAARQPIDAAPRHLHVVIGRSHHVMQMPRPDGIGASQRLPQPCRWGNVDRVDAAVDSIDSASIGNPALFQPLATLERELASAVPAPRDRGRVVLLVSRGDGGRRTTLSRAVLTPQSGMPGDAWARQRRPSREAQLTVMQANVATLIANGQPLALFGDNLILDLDLSDGNLPPGSRVRTGRAVLEVTTLPHNGCRKFRARFGDAALRFTLKPELRHLNLRGVYMRVVEAGEVGVGDRVQVVSRAGSLAEARHYVPQ